MSSGPQRTASDRAIWVDVCRGIAIILVVYGHALRGIYSVPMPPGPALQNSLIYAFHMPVFFVLAGLFLWPSIMKGRAHCLKTKVQTVLYPYFLWSLIAGSIELAASRFVNSPITVGDLIRIPIVPIEQFWFLYALFLVQLTVILLAPRKWLVIVVALVAVATLMTSVDLPRFMVQATTYYPYVAAGIFGAGLLIRLSQSTVRYQLLWFIVSWASFALATVAELQFGLRGPISDYVSGFSGTAGTLSASMLIARISPTPPLVALGRASMAIYVMHTIVSAGTRIVARMLYSSLSPGFLVALSTFTGLVVPYAIYVMARDRGYAPLLGLGGRLAASEVRRVPA